MKNGTVRGDCIACDALLLYDYHNIVRLGAFVGLFCGCGCFEWADILFVMLGLARWSPALRIVCILEVYAEQKGRQEIIKVVFLVTRAGKLDVSIYLQK